MDRRLRELARRAINDPSAKLQYLEALGRAGAHDELEDFFYTLPHSLCNHLHFGEPNNPDRDMVSLFNKDRLDNLRETFDTLMMGDRPFNTWLYAIKDTEVFLDYDGFNESLKYKTPPRLYLVYKVSFFPEEAKVIKHRYSGNITAGYTNNKGITTEVPPSSLLADLMNSFDIDNGMFGNPSTDEEQEDCELWDEYEELREFPDKGGVRYDLDETFEDLYGYEVFISVFRPITIQYAAAILSGTELKVRWI
jgi:hypothetical protein